MPKFQRIYWSKKFDWVQYSRLYNEYSKSKNNYYNQSALKLLSAVKLRKNAKIVDMACGTGAFTQQLLIKYPKANIFAIDLSKEMISFYSKNFTEEIKKFQIKAICGNAEKINHYAKEKYDAVFISSALWDLDLKSAFKNISKILGKDGFLVFNLPALVVGKEKGFIFFIEQFFRQALNNKALYRRIKNVSLKKLFAKNGFCLVSSKEYSFRMSKQNVAEFFNLLRYRYPFILFPKRMPYNEKLEKCTEIFNKSLAYIPENGIREIGILFVVRKK